MTKSHILCGVDEAGRGPWAGPVCAGAVILGPDHGIEGLTDSKKLSASKREKLEILIKEKAVSWAIGWASAEDIDRLNIRQATHLAMRRALDGLAILPTKIQIDGNDLPEDLPAPGEAIIKGDGKIAELSAASILAKNARDKLMVELDETYPEYGFAGHKGYGVKAHAEALEEHGPCRLHRMSFKPVAKAAEQKNAA